MTDYEEVVQGTIDDVKERVEAEDLDLQKVLEAERANKDRVTLVEWLEERAAGGSASAPDVGGGQLVDAVTGRLFIAGLLVGIGLSLVTVALFPGLAGGQGLSPAQVGDNIETYFAGNAEGIPLEGVDVRNAERLGESSLYRLDMVISANFLNRTVEQNQTAIVDSSGRYLFLRQPIDTERPLSEQLGQAAPTGGQGTSQ